VAERLAVYSTWYPGVEQFLPAWAASLAAQTDKDFDLWVGADTLAEGTVDGLPLPAPPRWIPSLPGETPGALRSRALSRIVKEGVAVVLVDSDDVLHPERIARARAALAGADVSGCALRVVDDAGRATGAVFGPGPDEDPGGLLPRYNVFGMSNTAWRHEALAASLPVPASCLLVDWLLATRAWASGARLAFDARPAMDYRQYAANTAKVMPPFSTADIRAAAARVRDHYAILFSGGSIPEPYRAPLSDARARAERFARAVVDPVLLEQYTVALNRLAPRYVWWWSVANPQLESIWNR
jgi:hypothetical protein